MKGVKKMVLVPFDQHSRVSLKNQGTMKHSKPQEPNTESTEKMKADTRQSTLCKDEEATRGNFQEKSIDQTDTSTSVKDSGMFHKNNILKIFPNHCQTKAKIVLDHIESECDRLGWNQLGNITVDGSQIKASSIIELLFDVVRDSGYVPGRLELWTELQNSSPLSWKKDMLSGGSENFVHPPPPPPPPGIPPPIKRQKTISWLKV